MVTRRGELSLLHFFTWPKFDLKQIMSADRCASFFLTNIKCSLICELAANGIGIKQVEKFNYLGSFLTSNGKYDCEMKRSIALSKAELISCINMF